MSILLLYKPYSFTISVKSKSKLFEGAPDPRIEIVPDSTGSTDANSGALYK